MKRNQLILLLILLLLVAGYFWLRSRSPRESLKPVFAVDSLRVGRIEISQGKRKIVFSKTPQGWKISQPIDWDVEPDRFGLFFRDVIKGKYATTVIGEGSEAVASYQLQDSLAFWVKVWDSKDRLRTQALFANLGHPFDYFRYAGQDKVYQIRQKVASEYQPDLAYWRKPNVLSISPDRLFRISVRHPKNSYVLSRNADLWHFKDKVAEFDVPPGNVTMAKIQNILAKLDAYNVMQGEEAPALQDLGDPVCEVDILLTDKSQRQIRFYKYGDNYLMTVDNHPDMYFEVIFDTVFRFTRHAPLFNARVGELPPKGAF